ncbi:cupredoxin domain-containing protein [Engelhardtia mirabilis]|uniref:Plastocyanin n=1 Tax=Engelhardtia mirabilis TaxID=2528011 RepID=A0A518BR31_9BACT|nr:Plastocyanin precursor [Planctomycetes bacterium Pla133]QDV03748.1 Plastocyanin precursor [Planctomycetes bacterium Pla86]
MRLAIRSLSVLALLAAPGLAQTTHQVNLNSASFSPKNITIEAGDTVRWVWQIGPHKISSGLAGISDGIFDSGPVVTGPTAPFEVTFDAAFLAANPKPGNLYDYFCPVHLPNMVGTITVNAPAGQVLPFGTAINPVNSLRVSSGGAAIGGSLTLTLENTVDGAAGPGVGLIFFSTAPDLAFPGGTLLPGFGLASGAPGELLVSALPPNPVAQVGPKTWPAGGTVNFSLQVPNDAGLVGQSVFAQGALIDVTKPDGIGLTSGLELVFG